MLSIESGVLLNGIICQMDHLVPNIFQVEVEWRCSDVALSVPVGSHETVEPTNDHVMPYIELPAFI